MRRYHEGLTWTQTTKPSQFEFPRRLATEGIKSCRRHDRRWRRYTWLGRRYNLGLRCSRPGRGIIVLVSGVLVLGADIIVLVSGRGSAVVMATAEGGVKRGVVNHVRRLEAGWCGRVFGGARSHRGRGAPYYRRILGGRSGQGLGCRGTVRRSVRGRWRVA